MSLACICTGRRQRPARPTATPTRIRTPTPPMPTLTPMGTVRLRVMAMGRRRRRRRRRQSQWPLARQRQRHRRRSRCCCPPLLLLALVQRVPRSSVVSVFSCACFDGMLIALSTQHNPFLPFFIHFYTIQFPYDPLSFHSCLFKLFYSISFHNSPPSLLLLIIFFPHCTLNPLTLLKLPSLLISSLHAH